MNDVVNGLAILAKEKEMMSLVGKTQNTANMDKSKSKVTRYNNVHNCMSTNYHLGYCYHTDELLISFILVLLKEALSFISFLNKINRKMR